jgi:phage regulator Rha-like protein
MNLVSLQQSETMSSREMAELCQKRHDSVKRTIEMLSDKSLIDLPQNVEYLDSLNRPAQEYLVGKRDSLVIVAQLSPEFMAAVVDRWQALENNQPKQLNLNDATVLRDLLLNYSEQVITLSQEVKTLNQAIETITGGAADIKFQQASKILGVTQSVLAEWLRTHRWDRYLNKSRASTAYSEERGYCWTKYEQKTGVKPSGAEYEFTQIEFFIKPKGMAILTKEFQ